MTNTALPPIAPPIHAPRSLRKDDTLAPLPKVAPVLIAQPDAGTTREGAQEARRRAAEIGDYALAEHWYRRERALAAQDQRADSR